MSLRTTVALALTTLLCASWAGADEPNFKKHDINAKSIFEAAGVFDVDNDGDLDIVSGSQWYEAPSWTAHKVRDVSRTGTYMNCFSTIPLDMDGDGDHDFITCSFFEKNLGWVENPGSKDKAWTYHEVDLPGNSEAAVFVDLTGDGQPDILPNTLNTVVFFAPVKSGKGYELKKVDLGNAGAGHGVGTGDINRDGRLDILAPRGWYECPEEPLSAAGWTFHPAWDLGATGIQILGDDFDGDGDTDLVYGMGHDIGLYWAEQEKGPDGKPVWNKHLIDDSVSSVHTLLWADLDGDGKKNEMITGKRIYAHEIEPGDVRAPVVAYYRFDPSKKGWTRHVIAQGEDAKNAPAEAAQRDALKDFAPGTAGTGLEMTAIDIDKDGDVDLVCPGKSGLYLFENLGTK